MGVVNGEGGREGERLAWFKVLIVSVSDDPEGSRC